MGEFYSQFLDDSNVSVKVRSYSENLSFEDMGFEDKRNKKPNQQWESLCLLARYSGEIKWTDQAANVKLEKKKERLTNQLQSYFDLEYDPFSPYKDNSSYKIKITLIPFQENKETTTAPVAELLVPNEEKTSKEKMDDDIHEYYDSLTEDSNT